MCLFIQILFDIYYVDYFMQFFIIVNRDVSTENSAYDKH